MIDLTRGGVEVVQAATKQTAEVTISDDEKVVALPGKFLACDGCGIQWVDCTSLFLCVAQDDSCTVCGEGYPHFAACFLVGFYELVIDDCPY